jgi:two-component system, LuxR family, response regulator FixJ
MNAGALICVVDDDEGVRVSLQALLESSGYKVACFGSPLLYLDTDEAQRCDCLIVDVRMPEMNGLALQEEIVRRGHANATIIITGHGDVPLAVQAMKAGAFDFIEKPFDDEAMLAAVKKGLDAGKRARNEASEASAAKDLVALLTPRERQVLDQLVAGHPNKVAAYELGISSRTVEIHRARIMEKMHVRSLSEVVRIALAAQRST